MAANGFAETDQAQGTLFQVCPIGGAAPQPAPRGGPEVPDAPEVAAPGLAALAARGRYGAARPCSAELQQPSLLRSSSFNPPPSPARARSGRGRATHWERRASWRPGEFFHRGWGPGRIASEQPAEEAHEEMPLSPPSPGGSREASPSKAPKKHPTFHIWRSKKKQSPRSNCGVFVPHPPTGLGETG